jgi:glucose-6-phosphate isomerase
MSFSMVNWGDGSFEGPNVRSSVKKLGQLNGIFRDQKSFALMDPDTVVYRVWWWEPVSAGTQGGLFWGTTEISPGKVGNEYFMTHGHRHAIVDRAEFYGTVVGQGMLVLREEKGEPKYEMMSPGSLHYIPGSVMHRVVNTGDSPLRFVACWHSDAGHDYSVVTGRGFESQVTEKFGKPVFTRDKD